MTNTDCSQIAIHFSKDCGRGTVAIKSLEAGDTILREKPLLTVVLLDGADTAEISRLVIEGYDNMDLMRKQLYDQLHASERQTKYLAERMPDMDCKDETLATLSRFDTNCFLLYYEGQSIHKDGIFYRSSFFNHSCTPNANWSWCHEKNELVIIATTPIEPGDEITIGYIDCLFHSRDQRQAACKRLGFVCRCSVCAQAIDPLTRRKLAKWIERYDENADLHSPQSLKCFDMIEYYALKSGLRNDELAWWYQTAAQEYMRLADDDDKMYSKAKRWWIQALSMYRLCRPASHPVVKNAERVLQNIERILLKPVV